MRESFDDVFEKRGNDNGMFCVTLARLTTSVRSDRKDQKSSVSRYAAKLVNFDVYIDGSKKMLESSYVYILFD